LDRIGCSIGSCASPGCNANLFLKLLKRDFAERYRGSYLGLLWSLLLPLLSLLVFTFFFGVIFKLRWGERGGSSLERIGVDPVCRHGAL
jgi:hypothetical protein